MASSEAIVFAEKGNVSRQLSTPSRMGIWDPQRPLPHTLSAARAPPCGRLKTELDRVFTCTVTFDDSPRVVSPATAYGRATEENMAAAAPGLRGGAQRPM